MDYFTGDKSVTGKYAAILRKYCNDHSGSNNQSISFVFNLKNDKVPLTVFNSFIDFLYAAGAFGLYLGKKRPLIDTNNDRYKNEKEANILANQWISRRKDFLHLYQLMVLSDPDLNLNSDDRVKLIFVDSNSSNEDKGYELFMQYACAGLEEFDKLFSNDKTYLDFATTISKIIKSTNIVE